MKSYYRIMLGLKSVHAEKCFAEGFVGVDFGIKEDLSGRLPDDLKAFNREFIPIFLKGRPGKSKIAAGSACGKVWTVAKGMLKGDVVLSPDGSGRYRVGEVVGEYRYAKDGVLPHRRSVQWASEAMSKDDMSPDLRLTAVSIGTIRNVSKYAEEILRLAPNLSDHGIVAVDKTIEDPAAFAIEKHLEDFLIRNWKLIDLGKEYDVYEDDGERVGQQFPTDTGPMDILALSKDAKTLLVVELKKGRASDVVVGQVLRYMGYVKEELAETDQDVRGLVIALEDDQRLRRALAMVPSIDFMRYEVSFRLVPNGGA